MYKSDKYFSIFQDGGRRHLDFRNFKFLTVKSIKLHHCVKSNRSWDIARFLDFKKMAAVFGFFKMAAAAILDFFKFLIFNGRTRHWCRTASPCQISSKLLKPRPRYVSFNIIRVWLENAYSRPLLGDFGGVWRPYARTAVSVIRAVVVSLLLYTLCN